MGRFSIVMVLFFRGLMNTSVFFTFSAIGEITVLKVSVCVLNLSEEFKILKEKIPTLYVT